MPPNMLKAKVGGGTGGPDMAAIKRAEAAMDDLECEFGDWIARRRDGAGRRARPLCGDAGCRGPRRPAAQRP